MSPSISLDVTPKNGSVVCNIDYSGASSEYLIFYCRSGSKVVKSKSSVTPYLHIILQFPIY